MLADFIFPVYLVLSSLSSLYRQGHFVYSIKGDAQLRTLALIFA